MATAVSRGAWHSVVELPETRRLIKPRTSGITMVIDKGLGLRETLDLLDMAADHIDFLKIAFGSSALYPSKLMKEKIAMAKEFNLEVYPGGTLFEIAVFQGHRRVPAQGEGAGLHLHRSIGRHDRPFAAAAQAIHQDGQGCRIRVVSEIGKKDPSVKIDPMRAVEQIFADLEAVPRR